MADFFNSINGFNTNAKDIINAENLYAVDGEEKEYTTTNGSFEFDADEGTNNDYFAITESEEYEYDYTQGTEAPTASEEVPENPFL